MKYLKFFKKWKIAVFALFVLCIPGTLSSEQTFANQVISAVICFLIAVVPLLPDILYLKTPAEILWNRWGEVEGRKAEQRKERAAYGELTPVHIDTDLKYGIFAGSSGGTYRTTLRSCSCPDFKRRKVPCKHMYYVAAKCGVEKLQ